MRYRLEKRFVFLYTGETTSIVVFFFVSLLWHLSFPNLQLYHLLSFWSSFLLLIFLLLQGSYYWYSKRKRLKSERITITPIRVVQLLSKLDKWNVIWMILVPLTFGIDIYIWYPDLPIGIALALFIYLFSILEYINYFHLQLSYDNLPEIRDLLKTKKLKKASLRKDFERLKR